MTMQPTVQVPSLSVLPPTCERDEKNPGLHCNTSTLNLSPSPTRPKQMGIPTVDEHKFRASGSTTHTPILLVPSSNEYFLLVWRMLDQALHKKVFILGGTFKAQIISTVYYRPMPLNAQLPPTVLTEDQHDIQT